ncbi:MAG TPA: GNAT family N-acetyltransferase [Pseudomonas sp.]|jgi:RimJ/RimL family protein N-acetyltransferase
MSEPRVILHTERLTLRELTLADVPALAAILGDAQVMRFSVRGPLSESAVAEFVQWSIRCYAVDGFGPWAVIERLTGDLAGFCALNREAVDRVEEVEIGYRLGPSFWGRGLATEAAAATLAYGFETLGLESIIAIVQPSNVASIRVIRKLCFRDFVYSQYHRLGVRIYRLTRKQWLEEHSCSRH